MQYGRKIASQETEARQYYTTYKLAEEIGDNSRAKYEYGIFYRLSFGVKIPIEF